MMIHLALDDLPNWRAGAVLRDFAYVHVAPDLEMMSRVYAEASAGLLPVEPVLVVGQPTAIDPSRAPRRQACPLGAGPCAARAGFSATPRARLGRRIGTTPRRLTLTACSISWSLYAPGLRRLVLARAVWSPLDLERENPNLIGGDNLSGSHHLDQNFFLRPVAGRSRYRTPVKGLYLCGASTWPGAGTGAGSGFMLAKMLAG